MTERSVRIPIPGGGEAGGVLLRPAGEAALPGVLFYTDIFGIRPAPLQMARRLADQGFAVLVPNLFHRTGEPPFFEQRPDFALEETKRRLGELTKPLTPEVVEKDVRAYVDFLARQPGVGSGSLAAVGYCFSGSVALRTAAARADRVGAMASFHAGQLATDKPGSPHLLLPRVKARLYFGHADKDGNMPPEAIARLDAALAAHGGTYQSEVYPGAQHGWTVPDAPAYDSAAAEVAFGKLLALLRA
jgi:carboxymethylenebutenolidase